MQRLKALSNTKRRSQSSLLLLEGSHLLEEAIKVGVMPLEIIATQKWIDAHTHILSEISYEVQIQVVTQSVLKTALTTINPDGVASVLPVEALPRFDSEPDFVLALDRIQDPGNLGTLFRTALAAEVEVVWLALGADPLGQKALRSSAGAVLNLPFERYANAEEEAVNKLSKNLKIAKNRGLQVVGALSNKSLINRKVLPYWEIDWREPTVLVLGNEGAGVHPKIQACCTHFVTLPHNEIVESLNVASAAVPLLLERLRAKMIS